MPSRFDSLCFRLFCTVVLASLAIGLAGSFSQSCLAQQAAPDPEALARAVKMAEEANVPKDPAAIVAVVGTSQVLLGDIQPKIDAELKAVLAESPSDVPPELIEVARVNFTRRVLAQAIQSKQMREMFLLEQVGTQGADKRREAADMMSSRARQMFYETEVVELKKKFDVDTLIELDGVLREKGTSLKGRERDFMDAMLGHMFMKESVNQNPHVTIAEINDYYITHQDEFNQLARASWEQFTVLFANHPTREAAMTKISAMGREAYFGGNFRPIARAQSEEPFAADGGFHDWTNQGSLASKTLDKQIFSLPLNEMSEIIEDDTGFHIVRVLKREAAGVRSLSAVQESIREKLKQGKIRESQMAMIEKMQTQVPVWTIFPQDFPESKPLNTPKTNTSIDNVSDDSATKN